MSYIHLSPDPCDARRTADWLMKGKLVFPGMTYPSFSKLRSREGPNMSLHFTGYSKYESVYIYSGFCNAVVCFQGMMK